MKSSISSQYFTIICNGSESGFKDDLSVTKHPLHEILFFAQIVFADNIHIIPEDILEIIQEGAYVNDIETCRNIYAEVKIAILGIVAARPGPEEIYAGHTVFSGDRCDYITQLFEHDPAAGRYWAHNDECILGIIYDNYAISRVSSLPEEVDHRISL